MRIHERLFDLGEGGVLGLTTHSGSYGPMAAEKFGRARLWSAGKFIDRLEVCTRPVERDALEQSIGRLKSRLAGAVPSVHKQLAWAESHFSATFREMPAQAAHMGDGVMLLGFASCIPPHVWRVVDVVQGRILWEGTSDSLKAAAKAKPSPIASVLGYETGLISAAGRNCAVLLLGMDQKCFVWDGQQLFAPEWKGRRNGFPDYTGCRAGLLSQPDRDRNEYSLIDPQTGAVLKSFSAPTASKDWSPPATSAGNDRVAIAHKGGTVDVVDGFGEASISIRPYPRTARSDSVAVHFSDDGRFLGSRGWQSFRVVDLDNRQVAEVDAPVPNMTDDADQVIYDSEMIATNAGIALCYLGDFTIRPYAGLDWQPVVDPGRSAKSAAHKSRFEEFAAAWAKPAIRLTEMRKGSSSRSHLYGLPDLPAEAVPHHDSRPMLLLARIDLADVSELLAEHPWPRTGVLYFFTAVDEEGNPLEDDHFNVAETRVIWREGLSIPPSGESEIPAVPIKLSVHPANLPDIAAAIVEAATLEEPDLEDYRRALEEKGWADQPGGHRLGGYPTILQNNDLEAQAAYFADDAPYPPRDIAELEEASRWRLLLQLDSDDCFMWGTDSGTLYFMIHEDDLAKRDFSRVVSMCEGC